MKRRFPRLALVTLVTTYSLIIVGALVRASGAGMGCPDWPRCFERWVPPTRIEQVPPQLAQYFNIRLAWTEYLNRLLGMTTGIVVFLMLVFALREHRHDRRVVGSAFGAFVGVGLAGWLGKRVVERNLDSALVTVHMLVALAVVSLLIDAIVCARLPRPATLSFERRQLSLAGVAVTAVALVQIALGTRIRASIEHVARNAPSLARGAWITRIGAIDGVHRTLAAIVFVACCGLALFVHRSEPNPALRTASRWIVAIVMAQLAAGAGLAYLSLPPVLQIAHVSLGSLLLGALVAFVLLARRLPEGAASPDAVQRAAGEITAATAGSSE